MDDQEKMKVTTKCGNCHKEFVAHPSYHRKQPKACDPHGYCGGVMDERDDLQETIDQLTKERDDAQRDKMQLMGTLISESERHDAEVRKLKNALGVARRFAESIRSMASLQGLDVAAVDFPWEGQSHD